MEDQYFMKMALALAEKGRGLTSPNPMVGAVVVQDGRVVGKGWHQRAGEAHAEVNAIDNAGSLSKGATIYVTLEPCNHTGRTPPCTKKIIESGIKRTVFAMKDPNPDVAGGGMDVLQKAGIEVTRGVCEKQAEKLNEVFLKYIRTRQPFVILKIASTLDGRIATRTGDSKWVTGEAARFVVHKIRHETDAIMVGIGTVKADNPSLTARLPGITGSDPRRIVLDTRLSISLDARLIKIQSDSDTIVVCGKSAPEGKKHALKGKGVKIIEAGEKDGVIDLAAMMPLLGEMGITSLLIEGGSRVIQSALNARIVDKVLLFYAPKILGGDDGFPICRGPGPDKMNQAFPVRNMVVKRFENDILIEGYLGK
jgi:diaminohydroxyphosphoribosylaminopyrimidine deaminase/5-amino-6-(5-phosphoribosylamino)uracil reductase